MDGAYPLDKDMWVFDHFRDIGKSLSRYAAVNMEGRLHLSYAYAFMGKALDWYSQAWESGAMGPIGETFNGGLGGRGDVDLEKAAQWHDEHGCLMGFCIDDHIMEFGSPSEIEEAIKANCLSHKHMPRFLPAFKPNYWVRPQNVDVAVAAVKKYGGYA